MKYVAFILRLLVGAIFIYSAYTKIFPVELFEYSFVNIGIISWKVAPFVARLFIGLEFFLGAWLMFGIAFKKFTLKAVFALLIFFCGYLLFLIFIKKETGNCGCFGTAVMMTPIQALIKNIVLLFVSYLLYIVPQPFFIKRRWIVLVLSILTFSAAFAVPFIVNPVNIDYSVTFAKSKINYHPPLELLYENTQPDKPKADLNKGKWIVAFLSLRCPHCKLAAYKLNVMHNKNPELPIYFVMNGDRKELIAFYKETNAQKIPYNILKGSDNFLKIVGPVYPVIFWLHDGIVERKSTHMELEQEEIEAWLKK